LLLFNSRLITVKPGRENWPYSQRGQFNSDRPWRQSTRRRPGWKAFLDPIRRRD